MQSHTVHRDPNVFPEPEEFNPNRWISTRGGNKDMKDLFMPFGKGQSECIAKGMALMDVKLIAATLLKQYAITISNEMRADDMHTIDHIGRVPKGGRVMLCFSKLTGEKRDLGIS
jgi:cytochrome P450